MITIRRACINDIPSVHRVWQRAVRELCSTDYSRNEIDFWIGNTERVNTGYYERRLESGEQLLVAEEDGHIIGFGGIKPDQGTITALYVDPLHTRHGIGTQLLIKLEEIACEQGSRALTALSTLTAVPFYEALGFQVEAPTTYTLRRGQATVDIACVPVFKEIGVSGQTGK